MEPIRILHLDDDPLDAQLVAMRLEIEQETFPSTVSFVQTSEDYLAALKCKDFDIILSDYRMPGYDGDEALKAAQEVCPEIPFIMVTGELGEELVIETLKRGATDYVLKDRIFRLVPAIRRALAEAEVKRERKQAEEAVRESEQRIRRKLESVLSPEGDLGVLELGDLIDAPALQKLMEDFYAIARLPIGILDVKGKILVGVGWQQICTQFHRVHSETAKHCLESDTELSGGLSQGSYRLYKCRNNLWDIVTPIMVAGKHLGNIFSGQFFFDDEIVDHEFFRAQAQRYNFSEEKYLTALDQVPRLSRETVDRGMAFLLKLADMLSKQGLSNLQLARLLSERERLTASVYSAQKMRRVG